MWKKKGSGGRRKNEEREKVKREAKGEGERR